MNEGAVEIKAFSPFELSDDSYETCIEFSGATSGLGEMLGKRLRALLEDESNTYKVFFSNETAAMVFDELMIDYYNHPFYNEGDGVVPEPGPDQGRRMLFNRRKLLGGGCGNVSNAKVMQAEAYTMDTLLMRALLFGTHRRRVRTSALAPKHLRALHPSGAGLRARTSRRHPPSKVVRRSVHARASLSLLTDGE